MYKKLERCIREFRVGHTDGEISGALSEYSQIVKSVAERYTRLDTEGYIQKELGLDFMGDKMLKGVLEQASIMRDKWASDAEKRLTREDVVHLCCENGWFDEKEYDGTYARLLEVSKHGIYIQDLISIVWCSSGEDLQEIKKQIVGYHDLTKEDI